MGEKKKKGMGADKSTGKHQTNMIPLFQWVQSDARELAPFRGTRRDAPAPTGP